MGKVKEHATRIFILIIVGAFVLTSIGLTGLIIWQNRQQNKQNTPQDIQKQLQDQLNAKQNKEGKLEGTQLEGYDPIKNVAELQKIDIKEGSGPAVVAGASVTAHYTGAVAATGIIFQSSYDNGAPVPFSLSQVIKGWQEGVPGMKVGGKRRILIPADQAYGANPPPNSGIPPNAALVFDIDLAKIGE